MRATRDDVIECYRAFLKREPENDQVIEHQLKINVTAVDVAKTIVSSNEYKAISLSRSNASLNKCFEDRYIAMNITINERIDAYLFHYKMLYSILKFDVFKEIILSKPKLLKLNMNLIYSVAVKSPNIVINEGELSLILMINNTNLCELSFTFVPSGFLYSDSPPGVLISRLQGTLGTKDLGRQATRDMGGLNPQSVLLACLVGIADASNINVVAGVPANQHICYRQEFDEVFRHAYDENFEAMGFTRTKGPFFIAELPLPIKPLAAISMPHRRRAKKRRTSKSHIVTQAKQTWKSWSK